MQVFKTRRVRTVDTAVAVNLAADGGRALIPRTIRARITAIATLLSAVLLVVVSIVMVFVLRWQLTDNLDEGLMQRGETIAGVVAGALPDTLGVDEDLLVQVIDADGNGPRLVQPHRCRTDRGAPAWPSNGPHRAWTPRIVPGADPPHREHATVPGCCWSGSTTTMSPTRWRSSRLLAVAVPCVVVVLGRADYRWLTGRTLRPVERMRTEMAQISGTASVAECQSRRPATRSIAWRRR